MGAEKKGSRTSVPPPMDPPLCGHRHRQNTHVAGPSYPDGYKGGLVVVGVLAE